MKHLIFLISQRWRAPKQRYLPALNENLHMRYFWQGTLTLIMVMTTTIGVLADVSSLGFTIGKSDFTNVKKQSPMLIETGINKYSNGPMLKGLNPSWNIKGLNKTTLIFDNKQTLTAIVMSMDKQQFDRVFGFLSSKYPLVTKRIPFVGNKSARFKKENVSIEIHAPHMSFNMDVVYQTDAFDKAYRRISSEERRRKNANDKSQF